MVHEHLRWKVRDVSVLLLLTFAALLVHGYHPYVEDAEIYLPGVLKILHPELFPYNAVFFQSHAKLTLFPNLLAGFVRVTHTPLEWTLFLWQVAAIFLLLLATWELAAQCFNDSRARWAAVAMMAALLTMPVAGTGLYIVDQYMNPRNLSAFAALFAITRILEKRYLRAVLWLIFAGAVHPLMPVYTVALCGIVYLLDKFGADANRWVAFAALMPLLGSPSEAYHKAALLHPFHYVLRWQWYELIGAVAPILVFWGFSRVARAHQMRNLDLLCRALIVYNIVFFVAAVAISFPARFEQLARFQPLRSLHLLYMLMIIFAGGLLGRFVLKNRVWRWLLLFVPLGAGMFFAQRSLFPASSHLELPGEISRNPWAQAFIWIRNNTPVDAYFALDPMHMERPGEDEHGFRAMAERSMLADQVKDSGAVSMFPQLATAWFAQVTAMDGWEHFGQDEFRRLHRDWGVDWVVVQHQGVPGLECPYRTEAVSVCRLP